MMRFALLPQALVLCFIALSFSMADDRNDEPNEHTKDSLETVKQNIEAKKAVFVDVRDLIVHNWPLIGWNIWGIAVLYAVVYAALLVFTSWLVFRRKSFQ